MNQPGPCPPAAEAIPPTHCTNITSQTPLLMLLQEWKCSHTSLGLEDRWGPELVYPSQFSLNNLLWRGSPCFWDLKPQGRLLTATGSVLILSVLLHNSWLTVAKQMSLQTLKLTPTQTHLEGALTTQHCCAFGLTSAWGERAKSGWVSVSSVHFLGQKYDRDREIALRVVCSHAFQSSVAFFTPSSDTRM